MLFHQPYNSLGNYTYEPIIYDDIEFLPHFHKNFELIYVISGKVRCTADEKTAILSAGDYALCLSNEVHSLKSEGHSKCWVGVFSCDFVHAFEKKVSNRCGQDFVFKCRPETHAFLAEHLISEKTPDILLLKACLYAACSEYLRCIELKPKTDKSGLMMRSITDYISENYTSRISLSLMATEMGYNYHYLSKCFKRIFSMSFTDFINFYRLDAALKLLNETDTDITQIAFESGFQSVRSFNDFFKKHIGTTPNKYRNDA